MRLLAVIALVSLVAAEPPAANQYLPPSRGGFGGSNGYARQGAPSSAYGAPSAPSARYGAPSAPSGRYAEPSSQYGAPGGGFGGGFGGRGAAAAPSGPPAATVSIRFGGASRGRNGGRVGSASSRFGASAPSSSYGAPSALSNSYSAPSSSYGAPSAPIPAARFGASAPSSSYGAPAPSARYGAPNGGFNGYARGRSGVDEDGPSEPAQYEYSYDVNDVYSGLEFGHQETREYEAAQGEYRVLLPDGRTQIVSYEADDSGFRPDIRYEDPAGGYSNGNALGGPY